VRQHEDQLVVVELRREGGVDDQPARREDAHRRHAIVERDPDGGARPARYGSGTVTSRSPRMTRFS
jgi:hypothetical protein